MIISGRHLRSLHRIWMIIHIVGGIVILVLNFIFASYASSKNYKDSLGHEVTGDFMYFLTVITNIAGALVIVTLVVNMFIKECTSWCFLLVKLVWLIHIVRKFNYKVLSYATIILGLFTILSGLFTYLSSLKYYILIHFAGFAIAFILLEILNCIRKKNWAYGNSFNLNRVSKIWTFEKFKAEVDKGRKLVLFDDYVVDFTYYIHPGGQFFLYNSVG